MTSLRFEPLLVVEDVLLGTRGVVLLPGVPRRDLPLGIGDVLDLVCEDTREEAEVIGFEPDRDPSRVRLRVACRIPIGPGFEVWASQDQSHLRVRSPITTRPAAVVPHGAATRRCAG